MRQIATWLLEMLRFLRQPRREAAAEEDAQAMTSKSCSLPVLLATSVEPEALFPIGFYRELLFSSGGKRAFRRGYPLSSGSRLNAAGL
jgi:hypothetical protein